MEINEKQKQLLNEISSLFKQIDVIAEKSGVKPDSIAEILPFNYIDNVDFHQSNIKSLATSRKNVFETSLKSHKKTSNNK